MHYIADFAEVFSVLNFRHVFLKLYKKYISIIAPKQWFEFTFLFVQYTMLCYIYLIQLRDIIHVLITKLEYYKGILC